MLMTANTSPNLRNGTAAEGRVEYGGDEVPKPLATDRGMGATRLNDIPTRVQFSKHANGIGSTAFRFQRMIWPHQSQHPRGTLRLWDIRNLPQRRPTAFPNPAA